MDTADLIRHKPTGVTYHVACVHQPWVHTMGHPEMRIRLGDCELVTAATAEQREQTIAVMAESSGTGHRPQCARERIGGRNE